MARWGTEAMMLSRTKQGALGCVLSRDRVGTVGALQLPCSQPEPSWPGKVLCPPSFPGTISGPPGKAADILLPLLFYKVNPLLFPCRVYTHLVVPPTLQS